MHEGERVEEWESGCGAQSGQLHREIALHLLIATSWQVAQLATVCCLQLSWAQNFSLPDRTPKLHKTLRTTQKKEELLCQEAEGKRGSTKANSINYLCTRNNYY